jgi:CHASE2 domain-containing sensor protein
MVPGQDEPWPGVYVHACATHTLMQAPLWKLKPWAGIALAFVLCLLVAWAIFEICWRMAARHPVSAVPLTVLLSVAACIAVVVIAWALMLARVMWMEVFLAVFVIVAHCLFEVFVFSASWQRLKGGPARLGEALVVPPQSEESH